MKYTLFLLLWAIPLFASLRTSPDAELLSSDPSGVTIRFVVPQWREHSVTAPGQAFVKYDFVGATFDEVAGNPQVPYHTTVVAVPIDAVVSASVIGSQSQSQTNVKLAPFPEYYHDGDRERVRFSTSSQAYDRPEPVPNTLIDLREPAFFRDQRIVTVRVAALQFIPGHREVRMLDEVTIRLDFQSARTGTPTAQGSATEGEERLYRNLVLNYRQGRAWRKPRSSRAAFRRSPTAFPNTSFYTFKIREEGFYKIDGSFLESQNIDISAIDPSKIHLFNNGGRELARSPGAPRPTEALIENSIIVEDGGDGRFDRSDFILFYGQGVTGWDYDSDSQEFVHYINHYNFDNIYWLSFDGTVDGKRIPARQTGGLPPGSLVEHYQGMTFVEEDFENPLRSGIHFFSREFTVNDNLQNFTLDLPNAIAQDTASFAFQFVSKSDGRHTFTARMNGNSVESTTFFGSPLDRGQYLILNATRRSFTGVNLLTPGENQFQLDYSHSSSFGSAYFDWMEMFYPAQLRAVDNALAFTIQPATGVFDYRISGFTSSDVQLFDVTTFSDVTRISDASLSGGTLTFRDEQMSTPRRYFAVAPEQYKTLPGSLVQVSVRDLRRDISGAEFIIITYDNFVTEAGRLESLRENLSPHNRIPATEVVRISEVYNNFSGGLVDPTAIRDFIKYAYENWNPRPMYVMLFGDGDYDPKGLVDGNPVELIPTFQVDDLSSSTRLIELQTRTTDSWYTYVSGDDQVMDLAIGRLNAQTIDEARNFVDKLIAYEVSPDRGSWRNVITMVGDDELVTGGRPSAIDDIHLKQAEDLSELFIPESFDVEKIYLSEFPKVISASVGGVVKPAAKEALIGQMNKGTLIVNFIGHGSSTVWAHERIFEDSDNDRVQNQGKSIFFIAATCDWALFDSPTSQSQAEKQLLFANRGAVGMVSSTRLVFSQSNARFNQKYYDFLFTGIDTLEETLRVGDAFVMTRSVTSSTTSLRINDEKFHVYGDPTLKLAVPRTRSFNLTMQPDSVLALSTVTLNGEVLANDQVDSDFNGTALVNAFDSRKFVRYIPEAGSPRTYFLPGNSIYRGAVPVTNGLFTARFIVPKDISYGGSQARLSIYFSNDDTDGIAFENDIKVSSSTADLDDAEGPQVNMSFIGREDFVTGDVIDDQVTLVVELADTVSGINIAGEIGHRISLTIDPDGESCLAQLNESQGISSIDLTDLFAFNEGDPFRGRIEFPLSFPEEVEVGGRRIRCFEPGEIERHTLVVKAWDNANNSSISSLEVRIIRDENLKIDEVMNYPNPMRDRTTFTFLSNQDAEVEVRIYTISGHLIRTLEYPFARSGFNMVEWDGRDQTGDIPANGVYLYKVVARNIGAEGSQRYEVTGKVAIIR